MENIRQNNLPDTALSEEDGGLNLKKLAYTLLQYWLWFVISVFICLLCAFTYLRYATPVYKVSSKILIKDDKNTSPSFNPQDLLGELDIFNTQNNVNNEQQVLNTYYLLKQVVDEMQLNVSCYAVGGIKSTELYNNNPFKVQLITLKDSIPTQVFKLKFSGNDSFTINSDSINASFRFNDIIKTPHARFIVKRNDNGISPSPNMDYKIQISTPDVVAENYLKKITLNITDKQASVIEISLQETVPQKGEDILNKLYEVYTRMNEEDKDKIADSTISFINDRLAVVSTELSGVEKNIEQFKVQNQLSTDIPEQVKLTLNNASDVQKQLTEQDVAISVVQSIEDHLKGNSQRIVPNAGVIQDPTYITTVQEYNTLVLERDRQLETTKPDNPVVQNLNSQIEGVKKNLIISLENIKKGMQIARDELAGKNEQLMGDIKKSPEKERIFLDITRQQDVKQQLYLYLLQKREETAISKSGTLSNSRLIEPAKSDNEPFSPQKSLLYLVAFCAGIVIPSGVIYFKNLLNNTVTDSTEVVKETNAPLLGEIGHNSTGKTVVAEQNSRTALAEQFRAVRTNLQFFLRGKEHQVIMVTSGTSGEGKSFFSINLSSSLAISGKRVVLMELDLRKPKISKEIGLAIEAGFTDYLIGYIKKEALIKSTTVHPNLFLISSGTIPPNPAELLLGPKTDEVFAWLRTQFDYIIVDTPPAGVVIDSLLIGKHADASVYVVRQKYTLKDQLKIVDNFRQYEKLPNISILVNDVKVDKTYGYGSGYHYGYGYGYASDYYSDGKKQKFSLFKKK
jgi:capsular exopolysaccharide synthesis family protein